LNDGIVEKLIIKKTYKIKGVAKKKEPKIWQEKTR
jgi:hypothetical protein